MIDKARAEEICNTMYSDVFRFCITQLKCYKDEALEITQDTFCLFYEKLNKLNDDKIFNWLCAVAKKKSLEYYRKVNKSYKLLPLEETFRSMHDILITVDNYFNVSDEQIQKSVKIIIKSLNEEDYELYYKRFVEGKAYKEIAKELGITEKYVGVKAYRLRSKVEVMAKVMFSAFGQFIIRMFF